MVKRHLKKMGNIAKRYWPAIAIGLIIILAVYVRVIDYRWPYLRNIDSYSFYRQIGDIAKNGGYLPPHDNLMLAPGGLDREVGYRFYVYLGAYSYMLFNSIIQIPLWQFLIYFPALLAALMAIPMYYIGKTLYDRKAGVMAAFFICFDMAIISRTLGGDPDSDPVTLIIPLVVMALFLAVYKGLESKKAFGMREYFLTAVTGIVLGIWGLTWSGYWFIIWLITGFMTIKLLFNFIKVRSLTKFWQASKHLTIFYALIISIFFLMTVPFFGPTYIQGTIQGPLTFGDIKGEGGEFPNVYVSVAELQAGGDMGAVIARTSVIGGPGILISPFFFMIYALIYLFYSYIKKKQHLDTVILLTIWFAGPFLATIIAVRFSILFSAPMAIGTAILMAKSWRMLSGEDKDMAS